MCGILGAYARQGGRLDTAKLTAATNLLAHRGPDGGNAWADGPFFFGHRRLSIIDLSEGGKQPMELVTEGSGRGLVVTFNGELYNYPELKAELRGRGHRFRTDSDTEVLLHAYAEWGEGMLERLRGMFAFAIADRRDESLFLARDRFGEKPLLVHETDKGVLFASELRPIAALLDDRRPDPIAVADFLSFNYVPGERTMLAGVRRLPPGTFRRYRGARVEEARYWTPGGAAVTVPERLGPTLDTLAAKLDDATRIALRADVPVALFLSGGLDSSLTAESAVRQGRLREAFCLDIAERSYSEWDGATHVADKLGLTLHRVVLGPEVLDDFSSLVEHADDPLGDSSALAVWRLSREAAKSFKVVISGDGGDELLGGYLTYKATRIFAGSIARAPARLRSRLAAWSARVRPSSGKVTPAYKAMRFLRAAELPPAEAHFSFNGAFLPRAAAELLTGAAREAAGGSLERMRERHRLPLRPTLTALQYADATDYLPNDILTKVDRMTMAHGLESRAPLLDVALADFALSAAGRWEGSMLAPPKRLFRELARRVYGDKVADAKKQGFSIPVHKWLREGRGRALTGDLLSRSNLDRIPLFDAVAVERVRDRFLRGEQLGFEIWGLLVLASWYGARIARAPALSWR